MKTTRRSSRSKAKKPIIKKRRVSNLKSIDTQKLTGDKLFHFLFTRSSFYRDYELLHYSKKEQVINKLRLIFDYCDDIDTFRKECELCLVAAQQAPARPTYHLHVYLSNLIELYYSNFSFVAQSREIQDKDLLYEAKAFGISHERVHHTKTLDQYQRYLLFEYLVLDYTIKELARRRYCTTKTIYNHLQIIFQSLYFDLLE